MKDTDLLSTSEAARMFAVTPSTIRRWAHSGRLSHMLTPSGRLRFRRADLEKACTTVTSDELPDAIGEGPVREPR
jgi:excisionase family DNA binding protein